MLPDAVESILGSNLSRVASCLGKGHHNFSQPHISAKSGISRTETCKAKAKAQIITPPKIQKATFTFDILILTKTSEKRNEAKLSAPHNPCPPYQTDDRVTKGSK